MARSEVAGQGLDEPVGLGGHELDVAAHVGAALVQILAAAGDPPAATGAREEEWGEERPPRAQVVVPMDDDEGRVHGKPGGAKCAAEGNRGCGNRATQSRWNGHLPALG